MDHAQRTRFRALNGAKKPLLLVNVWDPASAALCALAGASAVATSSAALSWAEGSPDGGALPPPRLVNAVAGLARGLRIPLSVDVEDGLEHTPRLVADLVEALADAGAVGINIEDGLEAPTRLAERIVELRTRRHLSGLFVNARTDVVLQGLGPRQQHVEEVLRRADLYAAAGADALFVPGLSDPAAIRAIAARSPLPVNLMWLPDLPPLVDLARWGVHRLSTGPALFLALCASLLEHTRGFLAQGRLPAGAHGIDYPTMNALLAEWSTCAGSARSRDLAGAPAGGA